MNTRELRRRKLLERDALNHADALEWSVVMADTLSQTFEYQQCADLHVFLSIGSEPSTSALIRRAWNDGKRVLVPSVSKELLVMEHMEYRSTDSLVAGLYGIPEPVGGERLHDSQIKSSGLLAVVPLVAFNERLARMGYGKGFYDRFLEHREFFAFGFAFTSSFESEFMPESHDARLDAIITEQGIVRARKNSGGLVSLSF